MTDDSIRYSHLNRIFDKNRHIQILLKKDDKKKTPTEIMSTRMIKSCISLPQYD